MKRKGFFWITILEVSAHGPLDPTALGSAAEEHIINEHVVEEDALLITVGKQRERKKEEP
jgi:hypothetical protein